MKSDLQNLENNEAILLMYLADELLPQDRAEVDQMLCLDAALRSELDILRQTQELAYDSLQTLDAATRPPIPQSIALGRVSRLIRDWAEFKRGPLMIAANRRRPIPWTRISLTAAATFLVSYYVWFAYHPKPIHSLAPIQSLASNTDPFFDSDEVPSIAPSRELSDQEKLAVLSNSLQNSASDEASNLHIAEVASLLPAGGDADSSTDSNHNADQNPTGEP